MRWIVLILVMVVCMCGGCKEIGSNTPRGFSRWAVPPVVLRAKGEAGIVLVDAGGNVFAYKKSYYFAQVIMASDMKVGDVLVGVSDPNE